MSEIVAFTTPASAPAWKRWLVFSPLARIIIYAACFFAATYSLSHLASALHLIGKDASPLEHNVFILALELISILLVYVIAVRLIERRRVSELALRQLPAYSILGFIAGFLLLSTMSLLLWLMGSYHILSINHDAVWLPSLLGIGIATGIGEETIFRGVLYRISEEGLGTWGALIISALFFGGAHLNNPNATTWSAVAIAIEAGILLALVFHLTRSLWVVIGLHAAWNFSEGPIYGFAVSGFNVKSIIVPSITGSDWVTGGKFGVEGSVVAVGVSACISAVLLAIAIRRKTIVSPSWVRKRKALA
jgi:uncharacterized protein